MLMAACVMRQRVSPGDHGAHLVSPAGISIGHHILPEPQVELGGD